MLTAYVRARRFDVLQKVTYHWRIREDLTSTGQQKARIGNLRDRIAVMEQAHRLLQEEATDGGARRLGRPGARGGLPALPALRADRRRGLPVAAGPDLPHVPRPGHAGGAGPRARRHAGARAPRRPGAVGRARRRRRLAARRAEPAAHHRRGRTAGRRLPRRLPVGRRAARRPALDGAPGVPLRGRGRAPGVDAGLAADHRLGVVARAGPALDRPCRPGWSPTTPGSRCRSSRCGCPRPTSGAPSRSPLPPRAGSSPPWTWTACARRGSARGAWSSRSPRTACWPRGRSITGWRARRPLPRPRVRASGSSGMPPTG